MSRRTTVLRVYCGACTAERQKQRDLLGIVVSDGAGSLSWFVHNNRRKGLPKAFAWAAGQEFLAGVPLKDADISHLRPPDKLFAYCGRHGRGVVSSDDVLTTTGTIVLNLIAPA